MSDDVFFERIDEYELRVEIAQRYPGVLYEAFDLVRQCPVLVNIWSTTRLIEEDFCEDFEHQLQTLITLQHPNIFKVSKQVIYRKQGRAYWVMPFMKGTFLRQQLGMSWPISDAVRIAAEIARALDYIYQDGIVNGAIYPHNVFLTDRMWPLIIDFGLTEFLEEEKDASLMLYRAPEFFQGCSVNLANNFYPLGVILYEMLAGFPPFVAEDSAALYELQIQGPRSLKTIRDDIPSKIDHIVLQLLTVDPRQRFSDGAMLARALVNALPSDNAWSSRSVTPPPETSRSLDYSGQTIKKEAPNTSPSFWSKLGSGLWSVARWLLGKVAAALMILLIIFVALVVGATFLVSSFLEQRLASYDWQFGVWEFGGTSYILQEHLNTSLQELVEPYTLGTLTDLNVEFYPSDTIELRGLFQDRSISLLTNVYIDIGVPQIQLLQFNNFKLYFFGNIISDGINRGMKTSWEEVPVRLSVFDVESDGIYVVLVPADSE